MIRLLRTIAFLALAALPALATTTYVSQSGGTFSGGSACNGQSTISASSFNSGSETAGNTYELCGTISTALTVNSSGTSGSPITILFDTGAQIAAPYLPTTSGLNLSNRSWITVNGQNTGIIQSTNNGSPVSFCSGSPYTNSVISVGIYATNASNVTIENLTIGPLYVHVCQNDDSTNNPSLFPPGPLGISYNGAGNMTFSGNTLHDGAWLLNGGGSNITVANNTMFNFDHGVGMGEDSASGNYTDLYFYGNSMHDTSAWDTTDNSFHHDGIHLWAYCADGHSYCSPTSITNVYIYNNHFYGVWDQNVTAHLFFEANIGPAWIFNNYFDGSQTTAGLDVVEAQGNNISLYNNTITGASTTTAVGSTLQVGGPGVTQENNIISTGNQIMGSAYGNFGYATTYAASHNTYANGGSNAFVWCIPGTSWTSCDYWGPSSFSSWLSTSGETSSQYVSSAGLNSNGTLTSGSAAIGAGANLYSVCSGMPNPGLGALCYDAAGNARPTTGAWDAGAYQRTTSAAPLPPTNLVVTILN